MLLCLNFSSHLKSVILELPPLLLTGSALASGRTDLNLVVTGSIGQKLSVAPYSNLLYSVRVCALMCEPSFILSFYSLSSSPYLLHGQLYMGIWNVASFKAFAFHYN